MEKIVNLPVHVPLKLSIYSLFILLNYFTNSG